MGRFENFIAKLSGFFSTQEETRLIWPAIFLGLGSSLYFSITFEPDFIWSGALLVSLIGLSHFFWKTYKKSQDDRVELKYLLFLLSSALLLTGACFTLAQSKSEWVGTPMIQKETKVVKITATLEHVEDKEEGKGKQLLLTDLDIERWEKEKTPKTLRITARTKIEERVEPGDRVSLLAKLNPPSPPIMPRSFDYARHFYFESIGGLGFAVSSIDLVEKNKTYLPSLDSVRSIVSRKIKSHIEGQTQGIVVALMTGERAAIDNDDWQALRASGLAHIISISGLHVAMVAAPIFFIVRLILSCFPTIALNWNIKKIAALVALIICTAYVGFVVPSVPTTRALLMTGVGLIAIMLDRSPFSLRLVGISAIIILIIAPESVWSASFQMSFAAVAALIAIADWMRPTWLRLYREAGWIKKSILYLSGAVLTSFVASLATAPFVWYHFQQLAIYSVVGNMLAMPLSGIIIMPMLILSYFLMPLGLESIPLQLMSWGVEQLLNVARLVQSFPASLIMGEAVSPIFLYTMTVAGLVIILFKAHMKWIAVPLVVIAFFMVLTASHPQILISNNAELLLVKSGNEAYLSNTRKERFVRDQWLQHIGVEKENILSFPMEGTLNLKGQIKVSCDKTLCRIETPTQKISYGRNLVALNDDCQWADILVAPKWMDRNFCREKTVMDLGYLRRNGAVSIDDGGNIDTTQAHRQKRPWGR